MSKKTKLLAGALCALVGLTAGAGDRAWGTFAYRKNETAVSTYNLTNVTAAGNACLKPTDMSQYPAPADYDDVLITFDPSIGGHAWGDTAIKVDGIEIDANDGITYYFEGTSTLVSLQTVGTNSMITVRRASATDTKAASFSGLTFVGVGQDMDDFAPYDGGAIHVIGGSLQLSGCSFTNFVTRFSGGAVCGELLSGGAYIAGSTFTDNRSHPINGYGGALYLTARAGYGTSTKGTITGCKFVGNSAENGGAICGLTTIGDEEVPLPIVIKNGTVLFEGNSAVYEGGAIITEGDLLIYGTGVVFRANAAGISGGAICQTGIVGASEPTHLVVSNGCTFADNVVSNGVEWTVGGAIAVLTSGSTVKLDDCVTFTNNQAWGATDMQALGGAIYTADYVTNDFVRAMFIGNFAKAGDQFCYGDAVSAARTRMTVDTCVFDCGTNANAKSYGNAIDFYEADALLLNSTFRRGKVEAVSACAGSIAITNCVIVGNGSSGDLYLEGTIPVTMAYSAYGKMQIDIDNGATFTGLNNLSNRVDTEVYDGDTLRLRGDCFNPVAGLGLVQDGVGDYDKVGYGSMPLGYSMGAYETNTLPLTVEYYGEKDYDGNTSSNGCATWEWRSYTNAVDGPLVLTDDADWNHLYAGKLKDAYACTNWVFGGAEIGYYYSTNDTLTGAVTCRTDRVSWLSTVVTNIFQGQITTNDLQDVIVIVIPDEYAWTGDEVTPGQAPTGGRVIVSNNVDHILIDPGDYCVEWSNNVNLTDSAVITVTATNRYSFVETKTFFISGYETQFYVDDILDNVTTNGLLSASNAVAHIAVPDGYCLDYQNSTTNKTVYRFGEGGVGDPDVTTLIVRYATDSNGDGVPDKYQKKLVVATVNGEWNGTSNAYDQVRLITMTNGVYTLADGTTEGKWSTEAAARCTLTEAMLPAVGARPQENYTTGSWAAGNGTALSEPLTWSSFPIYLYSYAHGTKPRTDTDKPSLKLLALSAAPDTGSEYEAKIRMTGFEVGEDGALAGSVMAEVCRAADGVRLAGTELSQTKIVVLGVENLGDEWFKVGEATTDADGVWTITRVRTSARSVTATRTANGDRTATWNVSSAGQPRFFKVQLVEE